MRQAAASLGYVQGVKDHIYRIFKSPVQNRNIMHHPFHSIQLLKTPAHTLFGGLARSRLVGYFNGGLLVDAIEIVHFHIVLCHNVLGRIVERTLVRIPINVSGTGSESRAQARTHKSSAFGLFRAGPVGVGGDICLPLRVCIVVVVAVGGAVFGVDEEVATSQCVDSHIHETGERHQTTGNTEVGFAGRVTPSCGHTTGGKR